MKKENFSASTQSRNFQSIKMLMFCHILYSTENRPTHPQTHTYVELNGSAPLKKKIKKSKS